MKHKHMIAHGQIFHGNGFSLSGRKMLISASRTDYHCFSLLFLCFSGFSQNPGCVAGRFLLQTFLPQFFRQYQILCPHVHGCTSCVWIQCFLNILYCKRLPELSYIFLHKKETGILHKDMFCFLSILPVRKDLTLEIKMFHTFPLQAVLLPPSSPALWQSPYPEQGLLPLKADLRPLPARYSLFSGTAPGPLQDWK